MSFICPICGAGAKTERGLKIHMSRVHKGESVPKKEEPVQEEPVQEEPVQEEPVQEEPVQEEPVQEEPVKTLTPWDMGVKEIPLGSVVLLNGTFWWKNPETNAYENKEAVSLEGRVVAKMEQQGFSYLQLVSGDSEWCCLEGDVLNGGIKLVSIKDPVPVNVGLDSITEGSLEESTEKFSDSFDNDAYSKYRDACMKYAEARDNKNKMEAVYKTVDAEVRSTILEFLSENGEESDVGVGDEVFKDDLFEVQYTFTPGKVTVKRDEVAIIKWCLENGHFYAVKEALDTAIWESIVEQGKVPADFLAEVQEPVQGKDIRKLLVKDASKN